MSESFRDLLVWQKAMSFVTEIHRLTDAFPSREIYGLTNQIRRSAVSIPSNIAEGKGRVSKKEYLQFLARARGSSFEVQTQLEIAKNLGYIGDEAFDRLQHDAAEVGRLLNGLMRYVRGEIRAGLRGISSR